jgi:hypothetical protein
VQRRGLRLRGETLPGRRPRLLYRFQRRTTPSTLVLFSLRASLSLHLPHKSNPFFPKEIKLLRPHPLPTFTVKSPGNYSTGRRSFAPGERLAPAGYQQEGFKLCWCDRGCSAVRAADRAISQFCGIGNLPTAPLGAASPAPVTRDLGRSAFLLAWVWHRVCSRLPVVAAVVLKLHSQIHEGTRASPFAVVRAFASSDPILPSLCN